MAHKTMIDGTVYEVKGGKCMVDSTVYDIKSGKTMQNGTVYDITFSLPPEVIDLFSGSTGTTINCVKRANGYWVVGGMYYDGSTYYARIAYATELDGTWITKDLWSSNYGENFISDIEYADGHWAVAGKETASDVYTYGNIAHTTNLGGTWEKMSVGTTGNSYNQFNFIKYIGGYWVAGGRIYEGGYKAYIVYTNDINISWTGKALWGNSYRYVEVNDIVYTEGLYWVAVGKVCTSNNYSYTQYAFTTALNSTWTTKELWSGSTTHNTISSIVQIDNYWVVSGLYYDGSRYYARIAYTNNLTTAWTIVDVWSDTGQSIIHSIQYKGGYWVVCGGRINGTSHYAVIGYATSLSGSWIVEDLWSSTGDSYVKDVDYSDEYWIVCGVYNNLLGRISYAPELSKLIQAS